MDFDYLTKPNSWYENYLDWFKRLFRLQTRRDKIAIQLMYGWNKNYPEVAVRISK